MRGKFFLKMDVSDFYEGRKIVAYHPRKTLVQRKGLRRFLSYDDRFDTVVKRLNYLIGKFREEIKILDVGVGDGVYESLIDKDLMKQCNFYGVDISNKQLARAKKYLKEAKVVDLNRQRLPYKEGFFDIIVVSEILEHIFYPQKVLSDSERVLKKGGYLVLTFPNTGSLQLRLSLFLTGASPLLNYPQNREHIRFFNKEGILALLPQDLKLEFRQGVGSCLFGNWNFPIKVVTPRFLQILGNRFLPSLALGQILIFKK